MKFNHDLVNRFVSDYKYPFPITFDKKLFKYYLNIFSLMGSDCREKWEELNHIIKQEYSGDSNNFLVNYYLVRENIIQTISKSSHYQLFNKMKMDKFQVTQRPDIPSKGIYNNDNVGKMFLSIDVKKANFQALKYVNRDIVRNCDTYEEFIMSFCNEYPLMGKYISESKYTRQVIFGTMNPKRHITIEKYMINEIRKEFDSWLETYKVDKQFKLISMGVDELVYEVDPSDVSEDILRLFVNVFSLASIDVNVEYFELEGYNLCYKKSGSVAKTFYNKKSRFHNPLKPNLKCVPLPFAPIIYKMFYGFNLNKKDKYFNYEGMITEIKEKFKLNQILKN